MSNTTTYNELDQAVNTFMAHGDAASCVSTQQTFSFGQYNSPINEE
jgi:hypothetical protein